MPRLNRRVTFNLQKLKMAQDIEMQPLDKPPSGYQFLYSGFYYGQVTAAKNESRFVWVNANKKRPARGEVSGFARILRYLCCMTFADMEMDTMDSPSVPKMQYKITVEIFTSKMQQLIYEIELLYANGE